MLLQEKKYTEHEWFNVTILISDGFIIDKGELISEENLPDGQAFCGLLEEAGTIFKCEGFDYPTRYVNVTKYNMN